MRARLRGRSPRAPEIFRTLERVELALESAGIGLWELDLTAGTLRWDEAHERLAGLEPGTFGGTREDFFALVHPDDVAAITAASTAAIHDGEFGGAYRVILPDGGIRWLEGKGTMFRSAAGHLIALGITHDVTARREAEERRHVAEQKALDILESIGTAFVAVERDWRLSYVNAAAESLFATRRRHLLGSSLWDMPGAFEPEFEPRLRAAMAGEAAEFTAFWQAGARWLEVRVFPTATGISIYTNDVTDRHRLEDDLRQAQKLQAVGQLAGGVAHDFNNLLTAVSGYAGLLSGRADLPADALKQVDGIVHAAARAAELTQQLLAFSRRQTLLPAVLDPNELVRRATPMLERVVGEHIRFEIETRDGLRRVHADAGQLEQVLMNLVVNAAQAMPLGGVLTISTDNACEECSDCPDLPAGHYVAISVTDTGCGMDEETASRAFEPFFTTKRGGTGTGLGLATVHGIARQSGGTARVASTVGEGTCVTVYLPATDDEPAAPVEGVAPTGETAAADTVLLVDDNLSVRDVVAEMLAQQGYSVTVAETPAHAIDLVEHGARPDILLTDVVMPEIGGPELAKRLTDLHPSLRTVLTSGYSDHGLLDDVAALNPVFLHKPFSADKLATALRSV